VSSKFRELKLLEIRTHVDGLLRPEYRHCVTAGDAVDEAFQVMQGDTEANLFLHCENVATGIRRWYFVKVGLDVRRVRDADMADAKWFNHVLRIDNPKKED
jgi:hypothetical protein